MEWNYVINSLTIMWIIQIDDFIPTIPAYCIYNCLVILWSHTDGKIEKARWWRQNLQIESAKVINFYSLNVSEWVSEWREDRIFFLPSRGTTAWRMAFEMYYYMSVVYQMSLGILRLPYRKRLAKIVYRLVASWELCGRWAWKKRIMSIIHINF